MTLKELTIEDKSLFDKYISNNYENSEATFANLFIWRNIAKTKYAIIDGALCIIYQKSDGRFAACYPFGECDIQKVIKELRVFFDEKKQPIILESVIDLHAQKLFNIYDDKIEITKDRDLFDYVYTSEALISLSGKKLHSKKNHLNKFLSLYPDFEYKELKRSMFDDCIKNVNKWLLEKYSKDDKDYQNELCVIKECFNNYEKLGFFGGVLYVNGKICAFTLGEKHYKNTFVVHIEKANINFEGAYAAINNLFVKAILKKYPDTEFINREEDMGIEGIRKAKLSYKPYKMVEKNMIIFNK